MMLTHRRRLSLRISALSFAALAAIASVSCARQPVATFEIVQPPPPRIESLTHGAPGGAKPGDVVSVAMKGDPGLKASATFTGLAASVPLGEDDAEKGLYRGSVVIPEHKIGTFDLNGRLEAEGGVFTTITGPSLAVLSPPVQAPPPARAQAAADFNAQRVLPPIYFDFDKADLRPDALEALKAASAWLQAHTALRLVIEGHCDERGTNEYNMALGDKRANAARSYLLNAGIDAGRIRTVSFGEERPTDGGHTEEAWAKNRRAEFVLED